MSQMWNETLDVAQQALMLSVCCAVGTLTLYAVTMTAITLSNRSSGRRRINGGQATCDDAWRYAARHLKTRNLPLSSDTLSRMEDNPTFVVMWLQAGEDWELLTSSYRAGLSDTELAAHLNHTQRLAVEQVNLLVALRAPEAPARG